MKDEELRQAMQALEGYNQQLESINRQARVLQSTRDENARAIRTIQALSEAKVGEDVLVPIGASCFVTVQVAEKKKAVISVGSKVSLEKDFSEATADLEENAKELNAAIEKTVAAMQEIQKYVEDLTRMIQNEYSVRRQQGLSQQ